MNVLITGGYSFISQFAARRFHKEGCQITLISDATEDALKDNVPKGIKEKFKCYHVDGNLEKYDRIFKNSKFDIVIHIENRQEQEAEKRFRTFAALVDLGMKYKIKQFVYMPCVKDAQENLYTLLKEVLINSSQSIGRDVSLNLTTIIPGNIYGPGAKKEELEVQMRDYIGSIMNGREMPFKPKQTTYYYIDDVVDAIYKVVQHKQIGVFNLNEKTLQGWEPKYSLETGMKKTVSWYKKNGDFWKIDNEVEKKSFFKRFETLLPYGENILFFLITFLIAFQTKDNTLRYNVFPLDFNLIYIFLISMAYGMRQGIIAIFLACFSYVVVYLNISPDLAGVVYNQGHIIQLLIYVMVGIVTAYVVDNKRREVENLKNDLDVSRDKQNFMEEVCDQTAALKDELQNQILNTDDSLGKIYKLSKELNSLLVEDVYFGAVHTLEKLLKTQSVSIYKCNKDKTFLRLIARSKGVASNLPASLKVNEFKALEDLFETGEVFVNYALNPVLPMMMAPIIYNNEVIAVAVIDDVPFESLTLYYENFFRVAVGLIQNAISQALAYEAAIEGKKYIGEEKIIRMEYFGEIIKNKQKAKTQFNIPYTILKVEEGSHKLEKTASEVKKCIRDTDYIGASEQGELYIMLSNSDAQNSQPIMRRLSAKGIEVTPYKGVSA